MDPQIQECTVIRTWDARDADSRGMQDSETEGCQMFSYEEARDFYNWWGAKQDWQCWYEDAAVADLIEHLSLASARSLIEFGCGTGRLAESLLDKYLPTEARYLGVDVSSTMVTLAQRRLTRFGARAVVRLTGGDMRLDMASGGFDRFVSTYVLDLLSEDDIQSLIAEAHRLLAPGGLLGLVSLTHGFTVLSRSVEKVWWTMYRLRPALVGGCRPVVLEAFVKGGWDMQHLRRLATFGVPSEALVAIRLTGDSPPI